MDLHFTCRKCGGENEADLAELTEDPVLICEDCGQEADPTLVGDVAGSIDEVVASAGRLARQFLLSLEIVGEDDIPTTGPYAESDEDEDET